MNAEKLVSNLFPFAKEMNLGRKYPIFGWLYFIVMCALIGIPPLSGFLGKVLIGQGAIETENYLLLFLGFGSSIVVLYSLLRIFLASFFGETVISEKDEKPMPVTATISFIVLAILIVALGVGAEWVVPFINEATEVLLNPEIYIDAVLSGNE